MLRNSPDSTFDIRLASWPDDEAAIRSVRKTVFILEQGVPEELEWDGHDDCTQVLALDNKDNPVGTARMQTDGRIGRMAVLPEWRNRGIGTALLLKLLEIAGTRGIHEVSLHAQTHAADFYRGHGFQPVGSEFFEAGIPHLAMKLHLS